MIGWVLAVAVEVAAPQRVVDHGTAVTFDAPKLVRAGESVPLAFRIEDEAGHALAAARPAAWLALHRDNDSSDCKRKVARFLGGSLLAQPDVDLNEYYVLAMNDDATISVVDPHFSFGGSRLLAMLFLSGRAQDWALANDGLSLFVSVPDGVAVASTAAWRVETTIPIAGARQLAMQPDGAALWVATDRGAALIDAKTRAVRTTIALGDGPHAVAVRDDNRGAFVTKASGVAIVDARAPFHRTDVALAFTPSVIAYSTKAQLAYAGNSATGDIAAIDAKTHRVVASLRATPGFAQLRFAPQGRYAFLPNPERNVVEILDTASNRIIQTADISDAPDQVTFTDRTAYVRRRGSETVLMIPLDAIGRDGAPVGVADFPAGEHALGAGETAIADSIVEAPDGPAVIVANPADKSIYFYKEGMAAPMGSFSNAGKRPRATMIVDRSLRERAAGVYATHAAMPKAGLYDVVFFLDSPRIANCFALRVESNGEVHEEPVTIEPVSVPRTATSGAPVRVTFRLHGAHAGSVEVVAMEAPGVWQRRLAASRDTAGDYSVELTPPGAGRYFLWVRSAMRTYAPAISFDVSEAK